MLKEKEVLVFKKNDSTTGMKVASTTTPTIPMIFGNYGV